MKIVVLDGHGINPGDLSWEFLSPFGQFQIYDNTYDMAQTIFRLQGAQIALTNKVPINAEIMTACPDLKLICVLATGYNVIDCTAANEHGITVCNVPDYGTTAVAQFTFGLLLEICHQIGHHNNLVHQGVWTHCDTFCFWDTPQMELAGKTLGIIGFGRIGQTVGKIARAFGMQVLAHSRTVRTNGNEIAQYVDMDTLLAQSDIITIHCPLTPQTEGLINKGTIARMKTGAIILNTSRGPILDEAAVAAALASGKLRAAAADVVSREPISGDSPLLTAPNCIITPHMAWSPLESRQRILDCTARNIRSFLNGKPVNTV